MGLAPYWVGVLVVSVAGFVGFSPLIHEAFLAAQKAKCNPGVSRWA